MIEPNSDQLAARVAMPARRVPSGFFAAWCGNSIKLVLTSACRSAAAVLGLTAVLSSGSVHAADFPDKPIRIVVPYAAGGSTDLVARLLGKSVSEQLGQPVVVENRPGAGSNIGTNYAAKAKADGYTLVLATSTALATNPNLYKNLPFDPQKDFAPIILTSTLPNVVVVNDKLPPRTMTELNAFLKKGGASYSFASAGSG